MANRPSLLGIWVLCACTIGLLVILYRTSEGFASSPSVIPDSCGKYGWNFSAGFLNVVQQLNDLKVVGGYPAELLTISKQLRQYTHDDCSKMGGSFVQPSTGYPFINICVKPNDPARGNDGGFSAKCAGLNAQSTPGPIECTANGKPLGVPNKGLPIVYLGKHVIIPDGVVQLYTKDECNTLGGTLITIGFLEEKYNATREDIAKAFLLRMEDVNQYLQLNGETAGVCVSNTDTTVYSIACAATGSPSVLQKAWSYVAGT